MGGLTEGQGPAARYTPPTAISSGHELGGFACGQAALDDWLRHRALRAEGASARTYVVCESRMVVGYYCLATGGARHDGVNAKLRRNMPDPIPMMVLGRLAIDHRHQRRGLGGALLRDAMLRIVQANRIAGFRALAVHAKDDEAVAFYVRYGFVESPPGGRTLFLPVETIIAAL